ncbi:hypothetical protein [Kibdelosporangium philippinense]
MSDEHSSDFVPARSARCVSGELLRRIGEGQFAKRHTKFGDCPRFTGLS